MATRVITAVANAIQAAEPGSYDYYHRKGKKGYEAPPDNQYEEFEEEYTGAQLIFARGEYLLNTKLSREVTAVFKDSPRGDSRKADVEGWLAAHEKTITNLLARLHQDVVIKRLMQEAKSRGKGGGFGGGGYRDPFYAALAAACEAANYHAVVPHLCEGEHWLNAMLLRPRQLGELREWARDVQK